MTDWCAQPRCIYPYHACHYAPNGVQCPNPSVWAAMEMPMCEEHCDGVLLDIARIEMKAERGDPQAIATLAEIDEAIAQIIGEIMEGNE